ncbi:hypothetical protein [Anaeromyxobacter paludicola]|uniref:Uncharacterized protein n=1 Tax=Anaeromyxobacter paludicola TaxID=2918171 RepID=A0ABM7XFZ7_9BACT|nr:hypothetical protein [Anaeromyxobacter paludicola]BDG10800.1 hypothetical protein AMPC_39130 [Anaeromyxobacter paludicola]
MRWPAAAFALLVGALGAHGLWFQATIPRRLPTEADWRAVAAAVAREGAPGDAAALAPWWAERGRLYLPERLPVLALPGYEGEDLAGVRRVFLVELPEAPRWDGREARELRARGEVAGAPRRFGALRLTRVDLREPLLPLAFLPDLLEGAEVTLGGRPCPAGGAGGFRCPGPPWLRVAAETREIALRPRACILAHPAAGAPLRIRFPRVRLGRALRGHVGIIGEAAYDGAAPVRLEVAVAGRPLGAAEASPRRLGWQGFSFDTAGLAGREAAVAFTVTSADPARRWFCFDAMTVGAR